MAKKASIVTSPTGQLPIGWVIAISMLLSAAPELLGRFLFQAYGVEYGITGMLTLVSMAMWGASAVYVIQHAHGMPRVTRTLLAGVCLMISSQSLSMALHFRLPGITAVAINNALLLEVIEDSCFVLGLAAMFTAFYLSVIEASRANSRLKLERENLANEVVERTRALEASQERYRDLIEHMSDAVWRIDNEGRFTFVSPAVKALSGYAPEELLGREFRMVMTEAGAHLAEASLADRLAGKLTASFARLELEHRRKDGSTFLGEVSTRPIHDATGRLVEIQGITRDITERKRAENALQNRLAIEELVATISGRFANITPLQIDSEITNTVETVGRFMNVDHAFVAIFSPDASEIIRLYEWIAEGIDPHSLQTPPVPVSAFVWSMGKITRGKNVLLPRVVDAPAEAAEEREVWAANHIKSLVGIPIVLANSVVGFLGLNSVRAEQTVTEEDVRLLRLVCEILANALLRQRTHHVSEEQRDRFLNSAKMSILGEMASNVAHEINNPLAIVSGSAEQLQNFLQMDPVPREHIPRLTDTIIRNVSRIQTIVKGLRAFARKGDHDPFQETSVQVIVDDTVVLCRDRFATHRATLTVEPIPSELKVACRPTQIMEVLFNLLSNALHAVEDCTERWVRIAAEDAGSDVTLTITDSGHGVPPEIAKTLFDRFTTTKDIGKGTGLGLNISKRIVMAHEGTLTLDACSPNTRFVIRLPKQQRSPGEAPLGGA